MAKVEKRKDGLYRYWYKGKQFYDKSDEKAKKKRDDYKYECEHGIERQIPVTVFDLVSEWLPVAKANVSKNTYNQYASTMEKLIEVAGNKLVSAVSPADIKKIWVLYVGKSQSAISKASFLYKSFFQYAIDNGYAKNNPIISQSAKPHRGTKGSHRAIESWERRLIETVPHRCQPAALFMLYAGLRRGEVLALRKKAIYDGKIHVYESVKFIGNRPLVGSTKNESSVRVIPLFDRLIPITAGISDYVFPSASGGLCSESAFDRAWQSYLYTLSNAAGFPVKIRCHDLRHSFVTDCRNKNVDIHICMKWCGHASERMILQVYDHVSDSREESAINAMNSDTVIKQLIERR